MLDNAILVRFQSSCGSDEAEADMKSKDPQCTIIASLDLALGYITNTMRLLFHHDCPGILDCLWHEFKHEQNQASSS